MKINQHMPCVFFLFPLDQVQIQSLLWERLWVKLFQQEGRTTLAGIRSFSLMDMRRLTQKYRRKKKTRFLIGTRLLPWLNRISSRLNTLFSQALKRNVFFMKL
ncbi:unnamed protein product [Amaranthus hypochondriacus]